MKSDSHQQFINNTTLFDCSRLAFGRFVLPGANLFRSLSVLRLSSVSTILRVHCTLMITISHTCSYWIGALLLQSPISYGIISADSSITIVHALTARYSSLKQRICLELVLCSAASVL